MLGVGVRTPVLMKLRLCGLLYNSIVYRISWGNWITLVNLENGRYSGDVCVVGGLQTCQV